MSRVAIAEAVVSILADDKSWQAGAARVEKSVTGIQKKFNVLRLAAAGALASLAGGVVVAAMAYADAEKQAAKLESVLKATGNAAGFTRAQIEELATSLSKMTRFEDDAFIAASALLATFKNIKGDTFKETLVAASNLSVIMEQDLLTSVRMVARALNAPDIGLGALSRAGVQFDATQRKLIKTLVETGQTAQAQKIILDQLASVMGGAAAKDAGTLSGRMDQLRNTLGNATEAIGKGFAPALTAIANLLNKIITPIAEWIDQNSKLVAGLITASAAFLAVIVVMPGLVLAFKAAALAIRGLAIVRAAFGGPKAWALLIAGLAAAGLATASFVQASKDATQAVAGATAGLAGIGQQAQQTAEDLDGVKQAATGAKESVNDLRGAEAVPEGFDPAALRDVMLSRMNVFDRANAELAIRLQKEADILRKAGFTEVQIMTDQNREIMKIFREREQQNAAAGKAALLTLASPAQQKQAQFQADLDKRISALRAWGLGEGQILKFMTESWKRFHDEIAKENAEANKQRQGQIRAMNRRLQLMGKEGDEARRIQLEHERQDMLTEARELGASREKLLQIERAFNAEIASLNEDKKKSAREASASFVGLTDAWKNVQLAATRAGASGSDSAGNRSAKASEATAEATKKNGGTLQTIAQGITGLREDVQQLKGSGGVGTFG